LDWIVTIIAALAALAFLAPALRRAQERRAERDRDRFIREHFGESPYLSDILNRRIRVGMSEDELIASWGSPIEVDERVLKTKVVHTYKYAQVSARTFRQRVKLEDGLVVGWTTNG
jgi:hypothetical protein